MKVFAVFDETGKIYGVEYGEKQVIPTQMNFLQTEIPDGAQIMSIDTTEKEPKIIYKETREMVLEKQITTLNAQIAYLQMISNIETEVQVMSKNYEKVKSFYTARLWSISWVKNAVGRWITADEYQEITGEDYME